MLFAILLIYHLTVLRRDGSATADALAKKQGEFQLLVVDPGGAFGEAVRAAVARVAPGMPVSVSRARPEGTVNALIISGSGLLDAPDWVRSFGGSRIVVPDEAPGMVWAGGVAEDSIQQAAQAARQLAEGQPPREKAGGSGWRIAIYVAAGLFGLELLLGLFGLAMSTFAR